MSRLRRSAPAVWLAFDLLFYAVVLAVFWLGRADAARAGADLSGTLPRHIAVTVCFAAMALLQAAWTRAPGRAGALLGWATLIAACATLVAVSPVAEGGSAGSGLGAVLVVVGAWLIVISAAFTVVWVLFSWFGAAVRARRRRT